MGTKEKLHVVVEADRRVHPLAERDVFGRFAVDPSSLEQTRWPAVLDEWLSSI